MGTETNHGFILRTNDTDRLKIHADGKIGIPSAIYSNVRMRVDANGLDYALSLNGNLDVNGTGYADGGFFMSSDARYKEQVETLPHALATLIALRGVVYEWNKTAFPERKFESGRQVGFIAQEVEKVLPELVKTKPDGYKAVNYQAIIPVTVEAIKSQQIQINALKKSSDSKDAEIAVMKAKNAELETKLSELAEAVAQLKAQRK